MLTSTLTLLHVLASVIWVGGMFFAHQCLRPAALATLEPPQRLALWRGVFGRFFPWVWGAILTLLLSGLWLILQRGGMAVAPMHVHLMLTLGMFMAVIFTFLYFLPYAAFKADVMAGDWPQAAAALNRIRMLVATNLSLGLITVAVAFLLPGLGW